MITVVVAESNPTESMRVWFDRAVTAHLDYLEAYNKMRWGLRPRWGGSYQQMLQFADASLDVNRYDTIVPFQYVETVLSIAYDRQDQNDTEGGDILKDSAVNANLQKVINKYLDQKQSLYRPAFLHTLEALAAFEIGDAALAKKHLEAINYEPDAGGWSRLADIPAMVKSLR